MNKILITIFSILASPANAAGHGVPFYESAEFYVAVSFLLVVVCLAKPVSKAVMAILHGRVDSVLSNIQNVVKLRDDARVLLQSYQTKQKNAKKEIVALVKDAKEQANEIKLEALNKIEEDARIKEKELASRLSFMENSLREELTDLIAIKTIEEIKTYMATKQDKKSQEKLVAKAIDAL